MDRDKLHRTLNDVRVPDYRYYQEIGSTNDAAINWISDNAPEYALVLADAQTDGRGRNGRRWVTTKGASIALSIILYPNADEQLQLGLFSLASGLAVSRAIESQVKSKVETKWPNDVLIDRHKTAGVLAEAVWQDTRLKGLVIGIGVNLLKEAVPPAEELLFPATCLAVHSHHAPDAITLIAAIISNLKSCRQIMRQKEFITQYTQKMAFLNEGIVLRETDTQSVSGILKGIDAEGRLLMQTDNDPLQAFPIGDISLRPQ